MSKTFIDNKKFSIFQNIRLDRLDNACGRIAPQRCPFFFLVQSYLLILKPGHQHSKLGLVTAVEGILGNVADRFKFLQHTFHSTDLKSVETVRILSKKVENVRNPITVKLG